MNINIKDGILYGIEDMETCFNDYFEIYYHETLKKFFINFHITENLKEIAPYAFASNQDIFGISIDVGNIKLSEGSFYNCQSLSLVVIYNNERKDYEIPDYCFARCGINTLNYYENKLLIINLPYGITKIGKGAFMNSGLSSFNNAENIVDNFNIEFSPLENSDNLKIYDSLKSTFFSNRIVNQNYKGVYYTIPLNFTRESKYYDNLLRDFDYSNEELFDFSKLEYIGQYAFYNCYGLTTAESFVTDLTNEENIKLDKENKIENKFFFLNDKFNDFQFPEEPNKVYEYGFNGNISEYAGGCSNLFQFLSESFDNGLETVELYFNTKNSSGSIAHSNSGNKKLIFDNTTKEIYDNIKKDGYEKFIKNSMTDKTSLYLPNPYSLYISYWVCDNLFEVFNYCYGYLDKDFIKNENDKVVHIYPCEIHTSDLNEDYSDIFESEKELKTSGSFIKSSFDLPITIINNNGTVGNNRDESILSNYKDDFLKFHYRRLYSDGENNSDNFKSKNYPDCETYYSNSLTICNELKVLSNFYDIDTLRFLLKKHLTKKIVKNINPENEYKGELFRKYKSLYSENLKMEEN